MFGKVKAVTIVKHTIALAEEFHSAACQNGLLTRNNFALFEQVLLAFDKYICVYMRNNSSLGDAIVKEYLTGTWRPFYGNGKEEARQRMNQVFNQFVSASSVYANSSNVSTGAFLTTLFKTMAASLNIPYTEDTADLCYSVYSNLIDYISAFTK